MTTWLLTSTFYGQWLPGDPRGSVTNVRDLRPTDEGLSIGLEHAHPGEDYEAALPGLQRAALEQLKTPPVAVDLSQAEQLLEQFQETANFRHWTLHAVSIMFNHVHLVVEAPPEIGKSELLRDFKSYASRRLNRLFGARTWWSAGGSCRVVRFAPGAIFYVCHRQPNPLVVWSLQRGRISPAESRPENVYSGERSQNERPSISEPPA